MCVCSATYPYVKTLLYGESYKRKTLFNSTIYTDMSYLYGLWVAVFWRRHCISSFCGLISKEAQLCI